MVEVWWNGKSSAASLVSYTSQNQRTDLDIPQGRVAHNGTDPIRIYRTKLWLAGNGASRTASIVMGSAATSNFTIASNTSAQDTGWKDINLTVTNTPATISAGFNTNGTTYFGRATDSGNSISPWNAVANSTLYGMYRYSQVPTAPRTPAVSAITNAGFTLTWLSPTDDGDSTITAYQVDVSTTSNFAVVAATLVDATASRTVTFTTLSPGVTYYYRIAARNGLYSISGNPMSPWLVGATPVTTLSPSGGKRYNGTTWVDTTVGKRYTGTTWVDLTVQKRYNGSTWVDLT